MSNCGFSSIDAVIDYLERLKHIALSPTAFGLDELSRALKEAPKMADFAQDAKQYTLDILEYNGEVDAVLAQQELDHEIDGRLTA